MFRTAAMLACLVTPAFAQAEAVNADARRITVKMMPGITASNQMPTPELIDARKALAAGQKIYVSQMRQIADLGDGFAAYRFADWLAENADNQLYSDVAHYYGVAAATGRNGAIRRLIWALDQVDPATLTHARSAVLENILFAYAEAGNSLAIEALIRYNANQTPFGRLDTELEDLLDYIDGENGGHLLLHLALGILQQEAPSQHDLERAQGYINIAMTSDSLEARLVASNLSPLMAAKIIQPTSASTEVSQ